jgi:hypothetical protein
VLSAHGEMVVHILLRGDGNSVACRGQEMPIFECGQYLAIDAGGEALNYFLLHNVSPLVDGDFDDHTTLKPVELGRGHARLGTGLGCDRSDCVSSSLSIAGASFTGAFASGVGRLHVSRERLLAALADVDSAWRTGQYTYVVDIPFSPLAINEGATKIGAGLCSSHNRNVQWMASDAR